MPKGDSVLINSEASLPPGEHGMVPQGAGNASNNKGDTSSRGDRAELSLPLFLDLLSKGSQIGRALCDQTWATGQLRGLAVGRVLQTLW